MATLLPITISNFLGINNKGRETSLPPGALRKCENLDVTDDGILLTRRGIESIYPGNWRDLYAHSEGYFMCAVADDMLGVLKDGSFTTISAAIGPVVYAELNGAIFWSDGILQGMITKEGNSSPWGLPTPPQLIAAPVVDIGGLRAGDYQVTATAVLNGNGLESGAPQPTSVTVQAGGGVQVTVPNSGSEVSFNVYLTPENGSSHELRCALKLEGGATAILGEAHGKKLESLLAVKPFPASHLCSWRGRIWATTGSILWHTDSASPHWLFPGTGFIQADAEIVNLQASDDVLFFSTDHSSWVLQGAPPDDLTLRMVRSGGAVRGMTGGRLVLRTQTDPGRACAVWVDKDGRICAGKSGGEVMLISGASVALSPGKISYLSMNFNESTEQIIIVTDPDSLPKQAIDPSISEIITNGVTLSA